MSDTQAALLESTAIPTVDALHLDGGAIDRIATLGILSASNIEVQQINVDSDIPGLPKSFPVAIVNGEKPELRSIKHFAEEWREKPAAARGTAKVQTLESFIALVNRHKNPDSAVFADCAWKAPSLTAVIDYHAKAEGDEIAADNGKHRVHYPFPLSDEWQAWVAKNNTPMAQGDFAAWIEDRIAELSAPDDAMRNWMERDFQTTIATPAQLITLSRGLQVNVEAKVKDFRTLQSGAAQITFDETHSDADGKPINIPGLFVLRIAPFMMGEPITIPVRLRYRVKSGAISWFYQIYRPDASILEAVRNAVLEVHGKTELPVYEGTPEMTADGLTARV